MSGLLLKDFYILMKDCRMNVVLALAFSLFGVFNGNPFWVVWPVLMCGLLPGSIMGIEEQSGWMTYADTMPCCWFWALRCCWPLYTPSPAHW